MSKLKKQHFRFFFQGESHSDIGPAIEFDFEVNVGQDGEFYGYLPEKAIKFIESMGLTVKLASRGRKGFYSATTLSNLTKSIDSLFESACSRKKSKEELIIRYIIQTCCSYIKHENDFFPNGSHDFIGDNFEGWTNGTFNGSFINRSTFGFNVYTEVCWKREFTFGKGFKKVEYERWEENEDFIDKKPKLFWLNGITSNIPPEEGKLQEIIASEEIAEFFIQIYKGIFSINERIKDVLSPADIMKIAKSKTKFLGQ